MPHVCASHLIHVGELACVSLYLHVFSKQHECVRSDGYVLDVVERCV